MQSGLIFLMTDSKETIADISAGLGVIDVGYSVFDWGSQDKLIEACRTNAPAFVLCDLGSQSSAAAEGLRQLFELHVGELSIIPLIALGDLNVLEAQYRDAFAGSIPLPLQFPGSAQLLQRLVSECLLRSEQT